MTEALRQELRERDSPTRVSAISPGFVDTEFFARYHDDEEKGRETVSRFRVLDAADVAAATLYALEAPGHVSIHDVLMRPTAQTT